MQNIMTLLPALIWTEEGTISIQWDSEQNIQTVKERVLFLPKGDVNV